nr:hypothetical protein Iba_chr04dCG13620 [Ipomoea batatas]
MIYESSSLYILEFSSIEPYWFRHFLSAVKTSQRLHRIRISNGTRPPRRSDLGTARAPAATSSISDGSMLKLSLVFGTPANFFEANIMVGGFHAS